MYCKIPITSPVACFWAKGLFEKNFLEGGGVIFGGRLYMDEHLRFENATFCSSNCIFLRFFAHNLSLLLFFYFGGAYTWKKFSVSKVGS